MSTSTSHVHQVVLDTVTAAFSFQGGHFLSNCSLRLAFCPLERSHGFSCLAMFFGIRRCCRTRQTTWLIFGSLSKVLFVEPNSWNYVANSLFFICSLFGLKWQCFLSFFFPLFLVWFFPTKTVERDDGRPTCHFSTTDPIIKYIKENIVKIS